MQFSENYDVVVIGAGHAGCEVEAFSGRERKRGPRRARFSRDGVQKREPAAEILSEAKDPAEQAYI